MRCVVSLTKWLQEKEIFGKVAFLQHGSLGKKSRGCKRKEIFGKVSWIRLIHGWLCRSSNSVISEGRTPLIDATHKQQQFNKIS
jgi:hypothetical protein